VPAKRRFQLVLVKPSHFDDDGYVIRWRRAMIPSNSLAAVYGIAADCAERQVLGPDVAIDIEAVDETHTRVNVRKFIATIVRLLVLKFAIMRDQATRTYKDIALTPVGHDEEMTLSLLTNTTGAHAAVTHLKKIARLSGAARSV
jgi:hypothetical protein